MSQRLNIEKICGVANEAILQMARRRHRVTASGSTHLRKERGKSHHRAKAFLNVINGSEMLAREAKLSPKANVPFANKRK